MSLSRIRCPSCNRERDIRLSFNEKQKQTIIAKVLYCGDCDEFFPISDKLFGLLKDAFEHGRVRIQSDLRNLLGIDGTDQTHSQ